ncbi:iron complex outermembrane receptor protein [Nitrospirillum bahiense]|uniref:Iron complex outermembrane receptor protein n=1 Tax=Nitrospirillum amazonense TaxID=28077 RepID=A0A560FVN0_9PROT|nr:iron complex outermembrane receptor protein [Nitrospirillum amazonense]
MSLRSYARGASTLGGSFAGATLAGVAALSLCLATTARAQPVAASGASDSQGATELEEIIVTATRHSQALKDVPMAVDAVSSADMAKYNILAVQDVQQLTPGLEIANTTGRNQAATLRGIPFDPDTGSAPAVDVYFNEINIDAQTAFTSLYDVSQVEVLRGPQGLLRGRTAPAGAITITTRKPDMDKVGGYAQMTVSDRGGRNVQGAINAPIVDNVLAVRVAGVLDGNRINDVRNVNNGERSHGRTGSVRATVEYDPTPDLQFVVTDQYMKSRNVQFQQVAGNGNSILASGPGFPPTVKLAANGPVAGADDYIAVADGIPQFVSETNLITFEGSWDLGPATLVLNAGDQQAVLNQLVDLDVGNSLPGYQQLQKNHISYYIRSAELRLQSNGQNFWNYLVGVSYYSEGTPTTTTQPNDQFLTGLYPSPPQPGSFYPFYNVIPVNVRITVPGTTYVSSLYASNSFQFTDQLGLQVGARYTHSRSQQQSFLTVSSAGTTVYDNFGTLPNSAAYRSQDYVTGGANLTYKLTDDISTYISYGRSYRVGPASVGVTAQLNSALIVAKNESSNSYELGLKGSFLGNRLSANVDVFHQDFTNYIGRTTDTINASDGLYGPGIVDSTLQLNWNGNVSSTGIEAQLRGQILDNWTAGANVSYVDAHYENGQMPCNIFDANGTPILNTPTVGVSYCPYNGRIAQTSKFHLSANTEYDFDVGAVQPFIRALVTYQPGFYSSVDHYQFNDITEMNLYVGVRGKDDRWSLTLFAKNLFDTREITAINSANASYPSVVGTYLATPPYFAETAGPAFNSGYRLVSTTRPRELGMTLSYEF